jgi:hypothetical protein
MLAVMAQVRNGMFLLTTEDDQGSRSYHVLGESLDLIATVSDYGSALRAIRLSKSDGASACLPGDAE